MVIIVSDIVLTIFLIYTYDEDENDPDTDEINWIHSDF